MKKIIFLLGAMVLGGCSTHANIQMDGVTQVRNEIYENKSMTYEILYSQPKPGLFSGGEQLPLKPLNESKMSYYSASTLQYLPEFIFKQLPSTVKIITSGEADYKLKVELVAHDKDGLVYPDPKWIQSIFIGILTIGLGPQKYDIVADFDIKYTLYKQGKEFFVKEYNVKDEVGHGILFFDDFTSLNYYIGLMLKKHLILTLNNFFSEAVEAK